MKFIILTNITETINHVIIAIKRLEVCTGNFKDKISALNRPGVNVNA